MRGGCGCVAVQDTYGSAQSATTKPSVSNLFGSVAATMHEPRGRYNHTATLLADGRTVLVTGGQSGT